MYCGNTLGRASELGMVHQDPAPVKRTARVTRTDHPGARKGSDKDPREIRLHSSAGESAVLIRRKAHVRIVVQVRRGAGFGPVV